MLFAFFGKRELVERLFDGSLSILPAVTQEFWLATADLGAGSREVAKKQFESLWSAADPAMRLAIERRLTQLAATPVPLPPDQGVLARAETDHSRDERFGARPTLFSWQARGTLLILALNALMFTAEIRLGGGTNPTTLYRLGAMSPPTVQAGEWWRLVAAIFLHFGSVHLLMNMIALWVLGPFAEFAFGLRRFLCIYLLSGVGSMAVVMAFAYGQNGDQLIVGASGCVMGLVGATGAIMLRGWVRERALIARRRLLFVLAILAMQTVFDALVPQVSMTAHLSGAGIGFALGMLLGDRLKPPNPIAANAK
jgi:rhomboid protease GluP